MRNAHLYLQTTPIHEQNVFFAETSPLDMQMSGVKKIASTTYYTLFVNLPKNRIYCTLNGFWHALPDKDEYLLVWDEAMCNVSDGFTMLFHQSNLRIRSTEWVDVIISIQKLALVKGVFLMADVLGESAILRMQAERIAKISGMFSKRRTFSTQFLAETWLNEQQPGI